MSDRENTNWGRWGADDQRGALNLLSPGLTLSALGACRTGRAYALGLPIEREGIPMAPYRNPPSRMTLVNHTDDGFYGPEAGTVGANEDIVTLATHHGTHMDALCHVFDDGEMYNGVGADTMTSFAGARKLGIEQVGCVVGRAVLLDMHKHLGPEITTNAHAITAEDIESCAAAQGTELRRGDMLLFRTGMIESYLEEPSESKIWNQPGVGVESIPLIRDLDIVAVGADNSGLEAFPGGGGFLPVHVQLLVHLGVYIYEHLYLAEMARDEVYESLLVVAPLKIVGATGSPVNPVAIG